jgi:hypothetical protein
VVFQQPTATIDNRHRDFFAAAGDARQVWARRRGDQPPAVFFLADGGVTDEIRRQCAAGELVCPMADCPDPRFIARGGEIRRHHFAHHVAHVKHATAAVWRTEAMTMLADWAHHYRGAEVDAEDRDGLARVRVRSQRSGRHVELRVTYDRRYEPVDELADSSTQLLVGHTRGLLLPRRACRERSDAWWCGEGRLVAEIVYRDGCALAVNPEQRLIATLVSSHTASQAGLIDHRAPAYPLLCIAGHLDACQLSERGVLTPAAKQLLAYKQERERAFAEAAARSEWPAARVPPTQPPRPDDREPKPSRRDDRQAEYLCRAEGLTTEQRLALIKEMFLPRERP